MSADRYEIIERDGEFIIARGLYACKIYHNDQHDLLAIRGAIRQQQSDLAALKELLAGEVEANEAFRKAGGALDGEDMPTFCARIIAEAEIGREWLKDSSLAKWFPLTAERVDEDAQEIAKLRARLAAIDAAPTVATVCIAPTSDFPVLKYSRYDIPRINGTELIARPAKDGGT